MNAEIQTIGFDADKNLKDFINDKTEKLLHLSDKITSIKAFLKVDNNSSKENKIVEIKIGIPGNDLFAKKEAKTFEEATDSVVSALKRQIKKKKIKRTNSFRLFKKKKNN